MRRFLENVRLNNSHKICGKRSDSFAPEDGITWEASGSLLIATKDGVSVAVPLSELRIADVAKPAKEKSS